MRAVDTKVLAILIPVAVASFLVAFSAQALAAAERARGAPMVVTISDTEIVTTSPKGTVARVSWSALTRVVLRTTDEGPVLPDMFWLFYTGGDKPALIVVGGAEGDQALLHALQERLPGFRNDLLIEAMKTVDNHTFLLWERTAAQPAAGSKPPGR